jgi:RHH-type rel operon transcriptional repressor/antitoxin RelB
MSGFLGLIYFLTEALKERVIQRLHVIHQEVAMSTSIRLAPDIEKRLGFLAEKTGRTKSFYLREVIEQGLEDIEDYYLAADVLERVRSGREKTYSSAEVRKDLGLDD